jgi:hypothetical protein
MYNTPNNYLSPKINEQYKKEGPTLGQAQIYGGVKLVNRIPIPPFDNWGFCNLMYIK